MTIPNNIKKEHVIKAIKKIDSDGMPEKRDSNKFDLLYGGNHYAPKYIISIANIFANGEEYPSNLFSGGKETNNLLKSLGFNIVDKKGIQISDLNNKKLDELNILDNFIINEIRTTEKEQIIKARIGQSNFKRELLFIDKKCRLCNVSDERFLVASHIKPWSVSNSKERLDVNNGLLFCPNHDALFDKGLISFEDDSTILITSTLSEESKIFMNVNESMHLKMNMFQKNYMKWHRENIFHS